MRKRDFGVGLGATVVAAATVVVVDVDEVATVTIEGGATDICNSTSRNTSAFRRELIKKSRIISQIF